MTSVLIVDDETLVRFGFQLVLSASSNIHDVYTCESTAALATVENQQPDVVLLDIRMPRLNGIEVLDQIQALKRRPAVAMLTTFDTEEYLGTAIEKGAAGFLLKDIEPEALINAVLVLANGGSVLAPGIDPRRIATRPPRGLENPLTPRELSVLRAISCGCTNQQIANDLGVSLGTVKDDLSATLVKFGVSTRIQAALAAQSAGLLDA